MGLARYLHAGLVVGAFAVVVCLYGDYGVTWDEPNQHQYGKHVVRYYETLFADHTALAYLDAYLYGAFFDAVAAILVRASPLGTFETRHLLNALVGLAGILAVWKMARLAGGEGSAWLATALLLLEPSYFGHMFNNPKDIPFAVGYAWSVYYLMCSFGHLPNIPGRLQLKLGLAIGLTLGVRIGGLVLLSYLGAGSCALPGLSQLVAARIRRGGEWDPAAASSGAVATGRYPHGLRRDARLLAVGAAESVAATLRGLVLHVGLQGDR